MEKALEALREILKGSEGVDPKEVLAEVTKGGDESVHKAAKELLADATKSLGNKEGDS